MAGEYDYSEDALAISCGGRPYHFTYFVGARLRYCGQELHKWGFSL